MFSASITAKRASAEWNSPLSCGPRHFAIFSYSVETTPLLLDGDPPTRMRAPSISQM